MWCARINMLYTIECKVVVVGGGLERFAIEGAAD